MTTFTVPAGFTVAPDENCYSALVDTAEKNPDNVLFSRPGEHDWVDVTAAEFVAQVRKVAKGLIAIGVEKGDRIALLSGTRYEWALIDFAIMASGATTVAIYPTSSLDQIQWIVEDSGARFAIGETRDHGVKFAHLTDSPVEQILLFNEDAVGYLERAGEIIGDEVLDERIASIRHDDIASLVYTSGTTGRSKGCIITRSARSRGRARRW